MIHGITASGPAAHEVAAAIFAKIIAWWEHDETSGTVAFDSHTGGYDGTYNGSFTLANVALGANMPPVIRLDTATAYIEVPHDAVFNVAAPFEIMLWVRRNGVQPNFPKLLCKPTNAVAGQGTFYFQQDNFSGGGIVTFRSTIGGANKNANTTTALADVTPYMLSGRRNAVTGAVVYVNTSAEGTNTDVGTIDTGTNAIRQGESQTADGWNGWIGATAIFDDELTTDERAFLYQGGAGMTYAELAELAGM